MSNDAHFVPNFVPSATQISSLSIHLLVTHYDESKGNFERQFSWVKFTTKHFLTCDIAFDILTENQSSLTPVPKMCPLRNTL